MFSKKRTLERQLPFTEKYAVEIQVLGDFITILAIGLICFGIGFILGNGGL